MTQLFSVPKVPIFCDGVAHKTEARRGETVKVVVLNLRLDPLEKKLARAMPVGDLADTLFNPNTTKARPIRRAEFDAPKERQVLRVYAAPDTSEASIAFDQAKIGKLVARMMKDRTAHDLHFTATFGPAGRRELEFTQEWLFSQRFVSFDEAEPGLFDEPEKVRHKKRDVGENAKGEPFEFDAASDGGPLEDVERARPPQRRHASRHDAARARQKSSRRRR